MEYFNGYLNNVKASDELKEHTKTFLLNSFDETEMKKFKNNKKMKLIFACACAFTVVLFSAFGGYAYYNTPVNYVSLDINPSVELGLNAFDTVVSVDPANADGESIVQEENVLNMPVEDAIDSLVEEATDQGFVKDDGSTVIAVTAESQDDDKAEQLQEKSTNGVSLAMSNKKAIAAVYADCSDLSLRTEAKDLGISPGKYKLIKMLQTLDPTITVDQYKDAKVSEIISKANVLIKDSGIVFDKGEDAQDTLDKMQDAAEDMGENKVKVAESKQLNKSEQSQDDASSSIVESASANQNKQQNKKSSTSSSQITTSSNYVDNSYSTSEESNIADSSKTTVSKATEQSTASNQKQNSNAQNSAKSK